MEQYKTDRETCIDCAACLVCMTRTVALKYCNMCKRTYLGIMDTKGGLVETHMLLDAKHARVCPQKRTGDKWSWVCPLCVAKRDRLRKNVADSATRKKLKSIDLGDDYSGEDEW